MLTVNEAVADGHTPGPWEIDSQGFIYHRPDALTKYVIAEMESGIEANERLILAAPDLLGAGEEAEWFLAHYAEYIASVPVDEIERHPYLPDLQEKLEMLRAAIAKAKAPPVPDRMTSLPQPSPISTAASWPGSVPTLDSVMWELRRIDERLRCHGELWKMDAAFLKRLADHHENPVANPRPETTPKQKSAFIRQAEAHLVFGAYCDKERQRLAEKANQLEQGTLDAAKDDAWRISNEKIAERAIMLEDEAVESHQSVGEPDLLALIETPS